MANTKLKLVSKFPRTALYATPNKLWDFHLDTKYFNRGDGHKGTYKQGLLNKRDSNGIVIGVYKINSVADANALIQKAENE